MVGFALSGLSQSQSNGQDNVADPKLAKWEYKILVHPDDKRLNELGQEGWELVTVTTSPGSGVTSYLKRAAP
jgi:hypothetical protein